MFISTSLLVEAPALDLASSLDGGQAFRWKRESEGYRGVIGNRAVHLTLIGDTLTVKVMGDPVDGAFCSQIADYLDLGFDLVAFRGRHQSDLRVVGAMDRYWGLRVLRQEPWECLVSFICSATSNVSRIKLNVGSLARSYGRRVGPGIDDFAFPSPDDLLQAGEGDLRHLGLGFRAPYVINAARVVARGDLDLAALRQASLREARSVLMSLHGVGEKIADCVLAFSLGQRRAVPIDRWVRRAMVEWYGVNPELNNSRVGEWARRRFGLDGAYVQQYLFHDRRLSRNRSMSTCSALYTK